MQSSQILCKGSPKLFRSRPGISIGRIEDESLPGPEPPAGHTFSAIAFQKLVGNSGTYDSVHPTLEDGRRHAPPVGMNYYYSVSIMDLMAVTLDQRTNSCGFGNLLPGKDGVEALQIEVMECYIIAIPFQGFQGFPCNGMVEASSAWGGRELVRLS